MAKRKKFDFKKMFVTIISILLIGIIGFSTVKIITNEYKTIPVTSFVKGSINSLGNFENSDDSIVTKDYLFCKNLKVEVSDKSTGKSPATHEDYTPLGTPEENTVYIGTNVEYAPYVEYGNQAHTTGKNHFIKDASANHGDQYKKIMEAALKAQ